MACARLDSAIKNVKGSSPAVDTRNENRNVANAGHRFDNESVALVGNGERFDWLESGSLIVANTTNAFGRQTHLLAHPEQ